MCFSLLQLPEKSRQLCSPQQGLVKREDLHNAEKAGRSLIPLGMCCSNDRDIMISSTIIIVTHVVSIYVDIASLLQHISSLILQTYRKHYFVYDLVLKMRYCNYVYTVDFMFCYFVDFATQGLRDSHYH